MPQPPDIAVIIPFFESERHVGACIESIQAQRGFEGSSELILIDNGATDSSPSIVAGYEGLTLLNEGKPGAYAARNTAIRLATAPLLAFTDADCVADPSWLASIQRRMEDPSIGILVGRVDYPLDASWPLRLLGAYEEAKKEYVLGRCGPEYHFANGNNMVVRASVFEEIGLFREWRRAGDSELVHRLSSRRPDLRVAYEPSMRVTHLEFMKAHRRLDRLRLYSETNSQITDFRELDTSLRLRVLGHLVACGARSLVRRGR